MRELYLFLRQAIFGLAPPLPEQPVAVPVARTKHGWVVAYEVGGTPIKYMRWDKDEVWKWTKSLRMATMFPSEAVAAREVSGCDISWRYQYKINKVAL